MEPGVLHAKEMRLYLFGSPRLEGGGGIIRLGRRKSLALLAYLAVTGQPHDRAALTTLFWPERDRVSVRAALRQCLDAPLCPHFTVTAANLPDLVTISRLVAGLPLGLELAAAWAGSFPLAKIVELIEQPQPLRPCGSKPRPRLAPVHRLFCQLLAGAGCLAARQPAIGCPGRHSG